MVRGNWQHRVEREEARKTAAKQRKQRSEEKKQCKIWFRDLLQQLDRHEDSVRRVSASSSPSVLHIWCDVLPAATSTQGPSTTTATTGGDPPWLLEEILAVNNKKEETTFKTPRREKKKVHPRSKEAALYKDEATAVAAAGDDHGLLLCRSCFLKNKCTFQGKKVGCKYLHYQPPFQTLGAVLYGTGSSNSNNEDGIDEEQMLEIESSLVEATPLELVTSHPGAMEFLYHTSIKLPLSHDQTISHVVMDHLAGMETPASSIFYVAVNHTLIFDRLRGGMILDERDFFTTISNVKHLDRRTSSVGSECSEDSLDQLVHQIPSTVLEHILLFLPDRSVAAAAQVCKAWYKEIGQHSPNLWLGLLKRRGWPIPTADVTTTIVTDTAEGPVDRDSCRSSFMRHYSVMRDMRALSAACAAIRSRHVMPEVELAYQDFSRRKNSPHHLDRCVSAHIWSDRSLLVGYQKECSLRLFECLGTDGNNVGELRCKELIHHKVSPYQNTKKRNCELTAVDMDEHTIACLCSVSSDFVEGVADILVCIERDEFLLGNTSETNAKNLGGGGHLHESNANRVTDIGELLLDYVLSLDVVDPRLLPLRDFLNMGGEIGEVEVKVTSGSLSACGFGRFAFEVSISIPNTGNDDDDDNDMRQLDRKLVIYSSNAGAVIWAGESYPAHRQPYEAQELVIMAVSRVGSACTLVARSRHSCEIQLIEIDSHGGVRAPYLLEASAIDRIRAEISQDNFSFADTEGLIVTRSQVISLDVLVNEVNGEVNQVQSIITFFVRHPDANQIHYDVLKLELGYLVKKLFFVGENYLVAFASKIVPIEDRAETDADALDGQWFSGADSAEEQMTAFVICAQSKSIIGRVDFKTKETLELVGQGDGNTTGLALAGRGVCITGHRVRSTRHGREIFIATPSPKKKKRSSKGKRSSKKDGFARGQSLRG